MKNSPTPKVHATLPAAQKMPLGAYIQRLAIPGMSPEQARESALLVHTGKAGYAAGTGTK